jgi:hypothetical protein
MRTGDEVACEVRCACLDRPCRPYVGVCEQGVAILFHSAWILRWLFESRSMLEGFYLPGDTNCER